MTTTAFWLIAYDISSNRRRAQMARLLNGYGERVNRSVFLCRLDAHRQSRLARQLQKFTLDDHDDVRVYRVGAFGTGGFNPAGVKPPDTPAFTLV